ncbi:MAG: hypothetical protein P8176_02170 [Gammaproteobacteria bacterium]
MGTMDDKKPDKYQSMINSAFEQKVIEGSAGIVESNRSKRLLKEMRIHQLLSEGKAYRGRAPAEFLLLWDFSSEGVSGEYAARASKINLLSKVEGDEAQPRCKFVAHVQGHAKVYRLPSMVLLDTIILKGEYNTTRLNRSENCPRSPTEKNDWLAEAGKSAVEKSQVDFQSHFLPYGFVTGIKNEKKNTLLRISLGTRHGIKKGGKVIFRQPFFVTDPFDPTKKTLEFEVKAQGKVTRNITERTAWVKVDKKFSDVQFYEKDKAEILLKKGIELPFLKNSNLL